MLLSNIQKHVPNTKKMEELGKQLAHAYLKKAPLSLIIYLNGPLGAGKTTFVRGFLRGMNFEGTVKSPTYTLVETYELALHTINHFDFYRINSPQELEYIGIREYFEQGISLLEWPEKAVGALPAPDLSLSIEIEGLTRLVTFNANSQRGKDVLQTVLS